MLKKYCKRIRVRKSNISVVGGKSANIVATAEIEIMFEKFPVPWKTMVAVVENLGQEFILSAETMRKMPIVMDLAKAIAYVGPYSYKIPLYMRSQIEDPSLKFNEYTPPNIEIYTIKGLEIEPQTEVAVTCFTKVPITRKQGLVIPNQEVKVIGPATPVPTITEIVEKKCQVAFVNYGNKTAYFKPNTKIGFLQVVEQKPVLSHCNSTTNRKKCILDYEKIKTLDMRGDSACIKKMLEQLVGKLPKIELSHQKNIENWFRNTLELNTYLDPAEKELVRMLLNRFYNIFSKSKYDVGCTELIEFEVDTGNALPVRDKVRPMNPVMKEDFRKVLKEWINEGIIEPTQSDWASAIVPVPKKDGTWRYAVDYRKLNEVTKRDAFPVAHNLEQIANDQLAKAKFFISIDLAGAYLAVPVKKEDQNKLAMVTTEGLFKYKRMPFGAMNSGTTYARLMKKVVGPLVEQEKCLSFFDDHLITGVTFTETLFKFAEFLLEVEKANLRVAPSKTRLFVKETDWLGHKIKVGESGIECQPAAKLTKVIETWPTPENLKELQTFLGKCSYYRKFIKDFSKLTSPLRKLVAKEAEFIWTDEQQQAFETLKEKLCSAPLLAQPNFESDKPFILDTDASSLAIGSVLSQEQLDGSIKPVAYGSKSLNKAQQNYSVTRKELLAIVEAVDEFKYFLLGRHFVIRTDHAALKWLMSSRALSGQLLRWNERLQDYHFTIVHRPGTKHGNADALSRIPHKGEEEIIQMTEEDVEMYSRLQVKTPNNRAIKKEIVGVVTRSRAKKANVEPMIDVPNEEGRVEDDSIPKKGRGRPRKKVEPREPSPETDVEPQEPTPREPTEIEDVNMEMSTSEQKKPNIERSSKHEIGQKEQYPTNCEGKIDIKKYQERDPDLSKILLWKKKNLQPRLEWAGENNVLRNYIRKYEQLQIDDGIIIWDDEANKRLCVPSELIPEIIKLCHQHPLMGHPGEYRTYLQAKRKFYWPGMKDHISTAIQSCPDCIIAKKRKPAKQVPLGQTSTGEATRLTTFYMDIVGPWPTNNAPTSKKFLVTFQDAVTKFPEAWPVKNVTTETILKLFLEQILPRYGMGITIITDQGRQFTSEVLKTVCKRLRIRLKHTQSYEPHTNPVERLHRTLGDSIRAMMNHENAHAHQWFNFVPAALAGIRMTPLSNLPYSPYELMFVQEPITPAEVWTNHKSEIPILDVEHQAQRLEKMMEIVNIKQLENHNKNKKLYDRKIKRKILKEGDWIFKHVSLDTTQDIRSRKTSKHQQGPFRVSKVLNDRQVEIIKGIDTNGESPRIIREVVSRDRLTLAKPWDLTQLPTPLAWKHIKIKKPVIWQHRPRIRFKDQAIVIGGEEPENTKDPIQKKNNENTANIELTPEPQLANRQDDDAVSMEKDESDNSLEKEYESDRSMEEEDESDAGKNIDDISMRPMASQEAVVLSPSSESARELPTLHDEDDPMSHLSPHVETSRKRSREESMRPEEARIWKEFDVKGKHPRTESGHSRSSKNYKFVDHMGDLLFKK